MKWLDHKRYHRARRREQIIHAGVEWALTIIALTVLALFTAALTMAYIGAVSLWS